MDSLFRICRTTTETLEQPVSMAKDVPMNDERREELIAYLDGELDARSARRVEEQLTRDARLRAEAESLRQAWQFLDYLPETKPSASFTSQTLQRLSGIQAPAQVDVVPLTGRRWVPLAAWTGLALAAAVLSYLSVAASARKAPKERANLPADTAQKAELSAEDWLAQQPKAYRDELARLPAETKASRIAEFKSQERLRDDDWNGAIEHWDSAVARRMLLNPMPLQRADFRLAIELHVAALEPLLSPRQRQRLGSPPKSLDLDQWKPYLTKLVDLSDRYPVKLPPSPRIGPRRFEELPTAVRSRMPFLKVPGNEQLAQRIAAATGKWPEYALLVHGVAQRRKIQLADPLGPCRPPEFTEAMQKYIHDRLLPKLKEAEKTKLKEAEGKWPEYPHLILQYSKEYKLALPGIGLPGTRAMWDELRLAEK
jgi:hypothetical protein